MVGESHVDAHGRWLDLARARGAYRASIVRSLWSMRATTLRAAPRSTDVRRMSERLKSSDVPKPDCVPRRRTVSPRLVLGRSTHIGCRIDAPGVVPRRDAPRRSTAMSVAAGQRIAPSASRISTRRVSLDGASTRPTRAASRLGAGSGTRRARSALVRASLAAVAGAAAGSTLKLRERCRTETTAIGVSISCMRRRVDTA